MKKISYVVVLISIILITTGCYLSYKNYQKEEIYFASVKKQYYMLFNKQNDPIKELSEIQIITLEKKVKKIKRHEKEKEKLSNNINELRDYLLLKQEINKIYSNKILNPNIEITTISEIEQNYNKLSKKYKKYFETDLIEIKNQKNNLDSIEQEITLLFNDLEKKDLKEGITREQIENSKKKLSLLKQEEFIQSKNNELDYALGIIRNREEEIIRKKEEEIKNAWVNLNVPYISQNHNNILNGCEAASLLMGLQYKGYLKNMTLYQYAIDMPKSATNNAYEGFTHDIFGLEPRNIPHWIAPSALADFGRASSGNQNIQDATGYTLNQLNKEISNNNPVVIYATGSFKTPKEWIEGAPKNIHVLLLTGYNKITKEQIITDPWTKSNGETKWYLSKNKLESIYNAVGKKAVIIR